MKRGSINITHKRATVFLLKIRRKLTLSDLLAQYLEAIVEEVPEAPNNWRCSQWARVHERVVEYAVNYHSTFFAVSWLWWRVDDRAGVHLRSLSLPPNRTSSMFVDWKLAHTQLP